MVVPTASSSHLSSALRPLTGRTEHPSSESWTRTFARENRCAFFRWFASQCENGGIRCGFVSVLVDTGRDVLDLTRAAGVRKTCSRFKAFRKNERAQTRRRKNLVDHSMHTGGVRVRLRFRTPSGNRLQQERRTLASRHAKHFNMQSDGFSWWQCPCVMHLRIEPDRVETDAKQAMLSRVNATIQRKS